MALPSASHRSLALARALRRSLGLLSVAIALVAVHPLLVRAMAEGHVAHVLLGSGNATPPLGAATVAVLLLIVRLGALVLAPAMVCAAIARIAAGVLRGERERT